ncbi:MAG: tRNA guanosine(15) transglycosylase TgtA [Candidatus Heimdallarchaeaceae archaeon]
MLETLDSDLHGRICKYTLQNGDVITPTLLPVIDPKENLISGSDIKNKYKFNFVITSAYLYYKRYGIPDKSSDIHEVINYAGNVMMDSGAYQILVYGDVDINPLESLKIQGSLKPEIGVILDVPIGVNDSYDIAEQKILQTIERVELSLPILENLDYMKWALPIQGGKHLNLITKYIEILKKRGYLDFFDMFALGSVAPVMGQYDYLSLFKMIITARELLPYNVPLHLFGAGHPMIFPYIVALGCDTFDSAAYVLFAKEDRYMTSNATYKISNLDELPCSCKVCADWTPKEILNEPKKKRIQLIAEHNLHVSTAELRNVKSAIKEGRLWELLEQKSKSHPNLFKAFNYVVKSQKSLFWEVGTPITKYSGIKIYDDLSIYRPELTRIKQKIIDNYIPNGKSLFVISISDQLPPIELIKTKNIREKIDNAIQHQYDIALFIPFFGIVPLGLAETFPFSQFVFSDIITPAMMETIQSYSETFLKSKEYDNVILWMKETSKSTMYIKSIFESLANKLGIRIEYRYG